MPVPFEALIPYVLMSGLTIFGGVAMTQLHILENGGKWPRYNSDRWDRQSTSICKHGESGAFTNLYEVMERDRRLTGYKRGQSDKPVAPDGFELSNGWKMQKRLY